jgi:hypothetical protein
MEKKEKKKTGERKIFEEKIVCPYCEREMMVTVIEKTLIPSTPAEKERSVKAEKL